MKAGDRIVVIKKTNEFDPPIGTKGVVVRPDYGFALVQMDNWDYGWGYETNYWNLLYSEIATKQDIAKTFL